MQISLLQRSLNQPVALVLILALIALTFGVPFGLGRANAAQLTSISDTLTDSRPSVATKHVIAFTTTNALTATQTIKIQLDPTTSAFVQAFSTASSTDITATGMTVVSNFASCSGTASEVYPTGNYNGGSDENLTLTVCTGDTVSAGAKVLTVGAATTLWTNPSSTASYVIRITTTATSADSGDLRVAIVDAVTVTASVDTSLTFTVAAKTSGTVNGETVSCEAAATATALPFGTLAPGTAKVLCQTLSVTTNATNGFAVTVVQNQNLLSASGADIDTFKDGASTAVPTAWTAPLGTLDTETTYGHYGITSEDDLNTDEFGTALYAGNIGTARSIFSHTGPADGSTANKGQTNVAVKAQVTALQESATDYTNRLTYVATPIF